MTVPENEAESILVITPHPDDSESAAGGTIAKWCAEGKKVVLVVCTNGDKGTSDRSVKPEDLAEHCVGLVRATADIYPEHALLRVEGLFGLLRRLELGDG